MTARPLPARPHTTHTDEPPAGNGAAEAAAGPAITAQTRAQLGAGTARLAELADLTPGWADGAGAAIDPGMLTAAHDILAALAAIGAPPPRIYPTPSGGVQLEWHEVGAIATLNPCAPAADALLRRTTPMLIALGDHIGNGPVDPDRPNSRGTRCDLIHDIRAYLTGGRAHAPAALNDSTGEGTPMVVADETGSDAPSVSPPAIAQHQTGCLPPASLPPTDPAAVDSPGPPTTAR